MSDYHDIDIQKALRMKYATSVSLTEPKGYKSKLRPSQKKAVAYLYFAKRAGLFDSCGTGKTHCIMALACLLKQRKELGRGLYVLPAADVLAKLEEFHKFTNLNFTAAVGTFSTRLSAYNSFYDLTLVSYEILRGRDLEYLMQLEFDTIFLDESHVFRNANTKTAESVHMLTQNAERVVTLTATPIQMTLKDFHTQAQAWHNDIFGSSYSFARRYCVEQEIEVRRSKRKFTKRQVVGYKNMAQPLTSSVLTPMGWKTMGDLKAGSLISTPAGRVALVEQIFDHGPQSVYRVKVSDGSVVECTADHLWTVRSTCNPEKGWQILSTTELQECLSKDKQGYRLPESAPWQPDIPLIPTIDGYLLGLLLGDGCIKQGTPRLCVAHGDEEEFSHCQLPVGSRWAGAQQNGSGRSWIVSIVSDLPLNCRSCGVRLVYSDSRHRNHDTHAGRGLCNRCFHRILYNGRSALEKYPLLDNPLTLILRDMEIWGTDSHTKFIPHIVFLSSVEYRRSVLQGILDSDGWVSADGKRVHYVSVSQRLRDDVIELVRSIGGIAYESGSNKVVIRLSGTLFRLARKADRLASRTGVMGKTGRYIRHIEATGDVAPCRCIKLSSDAGLYVTDDFVPTHNSEFKRIIEPFFLRRSIADIEDELPELITDVRWGNLLPQQKAVYDVLKKGAVSLLANGQRREAKKHIHSMTMAVNSTAALADGAGMLSAPDHSWKFDWLLDQLSGASELELAGGAMSRDKVVVFAQHKATIRTLVRRLELEGIGHTIMTGDFSKEDRNERRKQFWGDPQCRVLIGTTAIECSANLHCARYMVAVDSLPNPQRVEQLVGRIRRIGSEHHSVVFVMLLTRGTFEEALYHRLEHRQATVDKVFDESSDIFASLSDMELLQLFSD